MWGNTIVAYPFFLSKVQSVYTLIKFDSNDINDNQGSDFRALKTTEIVFIIFTTYKIYNEFYGLKMWKITFKYYKQHFFQLFFFYAIYTIIMNNNINDNFEKT